MASMGMKDPVSTHSFVAKWQIFSSGDLNFFLQILMRDGEAVKVGIVLNAIPGR